MESEPPGAAFFLPGDGADPIWSEPEWAPGPWTSGAGAAQRSSGSATLVGTNEEDIIQNFFCFIVRWSQSRTFPPAPASQHCQHLFTV